MGWTIECATCDTTTWAANIVDLLSLHTDRSGLFRCPAGHAGHIPRSFDLQEEGRKWTPVLRGAVRLGEEERSYQPFAFLVSYEPQGEIENVWFSYYKDLRASGGRLKLGHGPGGPPVLGKGGILRLLTSMLDHGCLSREDLRRIIEP